MYLIVGLGNPEKKYDKTKHNVGFDAVDEIVDEFDIPSSGISMKGMYGKGIVSGNKIMVMKPLTYMNLSGHAVRAYIDYYNIDPASELIVIYDDVDLPVGSIRIRKKGSAGSHNGMKSIIQMLGDGNFTRIRVGIGPKPEKWDLADYVLAPFSKADREKINETIEDIPRVIKSIVENGVDIAMTEFNKKHSNSSDEAKDSLK